jgi:hypothetical protein
LTGGDYIYFGLRDGLIRAIKESSISNVAQLELNFNVDGLPVWNSNRIQVWPIQCIVANLSNLQPFVVALYCGSEKPSNHEFLEDFVDELKTLSADQLSLPDGRKFVVVPKLFICDAPAKAMIKSIIQFNGRYGCDLCEVEGIYQDSRMVFGEVGPLRTDASFRSKCNPLHHKSTSILERLDVDMIQAFPVDPMHCIDLGVTRRLLAVYKLGPRHARLSINQLNMLSKFLLAIQSSFPCEFNRKPRGFDDFKFWKAIEFRSFLLYSGPIVLKHALPQKH